MIPLLCQKVCRRYDVMWLSQSKATMKPFQFFTGWWLMVDTAAIYTPIGQWNNAYIVVTISGTLAMFM